MVVFTGQEMPRQRGSVPQNNKWRKCGSVVAAGSRHLVSYDSLEPLCLRKIAADEQAGEQAGWQGLVNQTDSIVRLEALVARSAICAVKEGVWPRKT